MQVQVQVHALTCVHGPFTCMHVPMLRRRLSGTTFSESLGQRTPYLLFEFCFVLSSPFFV